MVTFSQIFSIKFGVRSFSRPLITCHRVYRCPLLTHSGSRSLFGCSVLDKGHTPSKALAFFSPFFAGEGVLGGKALEVKVFVNASPFLGKLPHPAHSEQSFLQLACFLQHFWIDFCKFFFQSFFEGSLNRRHSVDRYNSRFTFL